MSVYTFVFCPKNLLKKVDKNIPPVEFRSMLLKFDKYFLRLKRSSYENNAKKKKQRFWKTCHLNKLLVTKYMKK